MRYAIGIEKTATGYAPDPPGCIATGRTTEVVEKEMRDAIRKTVESWNTTQAKAAKRLGVTQPWLNDLLKGRIPKLSLDALINHATLAGLSVKVEVALLVA